MTAPPRRFLLRVEPATFARWVLRLVRALQAHGSVQIEICQAGGGPNSSALNTLLWLESVLLRPGRPSGADRLAARDFDPRLLAGEASAPDTIIDLRDRREMDGHPSASLIRPLYDGAGGESALAAALFFSGTPEIAIELRCPRDGASIVAAGTASLEAAQGIGGAMDAVYSRVVPLIMKAIAGGAAGRPVNHEASAIRPIARADLLRHSVRNLASQAARAAYRLCCHGSHWRIGWRFARAGEDVWTRRDLGGHRWNVLADEVDHFYADPFPWRWKGADFLFFEDLDHKTGKGVIAVSCFDEQGRPGRARTVVEEPWHLSYPFLIESGGEIYMIPESSAKREVPIYRATDFPLRWERLGPLLADLEAADATIAKHEDALWMFAVTRDGEGGYSDMLSLWRADRLFGSWTPHPLNPVVVSDRLARPAGAMVRRRGQLLRPVQDCRAAYGGAIAIARVTKLDLEGFDQEQESTLTAGPSWPGRRIHTLNSNDHLEAIDGFTLRPKLKLASDLVDRYYAPRSS